MQINAPFNTVSAGRARDLLGITAITPHRVNLRAYYDNALYANKTRAFEAARDKAIDQGCSIYAPAGDYEFPEPLRTYQHFTLEGAGEFATRFLFGVPGKSLFVHGVGDVRYFASFALRKIGLNTVGAGVSSFIDIEQNPNSGLFTLEDVRMGSFDARFSANKFINAVGTTLSLFRNIKANGGSYNPPNLYSSSTQIGFHFTSANNNKKAFVFIFDNCQVDAIVNSVRFDILGAPGDSGTLEGAIFQNSGGRTATGAWCKISIPLSKDLWAPPFFIFDKCNMEGPGTLLDIDSVGEFKMTNCLMYLQAPPQTQPITDFLRIERATNAYLAGNTFQLHPGAQAKNIIAFGPNTRRAWVIDNVFAQPSGFSSSLEGGILVAPGADVQTRGNRFDAWLAPHRIWNGQGELAEVDVVGTSAGRLFTTDTGNPIAKLLATSDAQTYAQITATLGAAIITTVSPLVDASLRLQAAPQGVVVMESPLVMGTVLSIPQATNDTTAASAGVRVGQFYRDGSALRIRVS